MPRQCRCPAYRVIGTYVPFAVDGSRVNGQATGRNRRCTRCDHLQLTPSGGAWPRRHKPGQQTIGPAHPEDSS